MMRISSASLDQDIIAGGESKRRHIRFQFVSVQPRSFDSMSGLIEKRQSIRTLPPNDGLGNGLPSILAVRKSSSAGTGAATLR